MEKERNYSHTEEFRRTFGKRLRQLRKQRGYKIEEVVKSLGLSRSTYTAWELGNRFPMSKSIAELANFFNTTIDYLMMESDNPDKTDSDLKEILESVEKFTWNGKEISKSKLNAIAALIEASFEE